MTRTVSNALTTILAILASAGCATYSTPLEEPPPPQLSLVSVSPQSGSVLAPGVTLVRARLHYRLETSTQGFIELFYLCSTGGQLACLDNGRIADFSGREGDLDVAFGLRAPAGASISVSLSLTAEGVETPRAVVALSYQTAP